jgi:hypothetical protein
MHRLNAPSLFFLTGFFVSACGGGQKPADTAGVMPADQAPAEGGEGSEDKAKEDGPKKDECTGFDVGNLEDALSKSACEVPNAKPDTVPPADLKGKLETKVGASPTSVAPGGKTDLVVSFTNKTKEPLTLSFRIDPTARFEIEVYDKKDKRIDMPAGSPPPPPKGHTPPPAAEAKVAKFTIAPNGTIRQSIPWQASRMVWAPEKVRGSAVEHGYPRKAAGPLPKGKYTVKVVTPLVGVADTDGHVTAPKVELEIGG